ncbi:MAG: very short patch repair endonuclease [FCB group bacterium]|nr:very short patch repair endonuclease [FCB group bacterium]
METHSRLSEDNNRDLGSMEWVEKDVAEREVLHCGDVALRLRVKRSSWGVKIELMDTVSPKRRSEIMGRVRGKDTKPEMTVRRLVHSLGYRYRLHSRKLPGHPDLVFSSRKKVIFVHGCFWHTHRGCKNARVPKSRLDFWVAKLEDTVARDKRNRAGLTRLGWRYLVVWECQLKDLGKVEERIRSFLEN